MRRGFTVVELAIVVSLLALIVPALFVYARSLEEQHARGVFAVEVAEALRTVGEALRADLRGGAWADAQRVATTGSCAAEWAVTPSQALERRATEACGGRQALATHVAGLARVPAGVELTFELELRPGLVDRHVVLVPVGE
jgi:hypothetical protein